MGERKGLVLRLAKKAAEHWPINKPGIGLKIATSFHLPIVLFAARSEIPLGENYSRKYDTEIKAVYDRWDIRQMCRSSASAEVTDEYGTSGYSSSSYSTQSAPARMSTVM